MLGTMSILDYVKSSIQISAQSIGPPAWQLSPPFSSSSQFSSNNRLPSLDEENRWSLDSSYERMRFSYFSRRYMILSFFVTSLGNFPFPFLMFNDCSALLSRRSYTILTDSPQHAICRGVPNIILARLMSVRSQEIRSSMMSMNQKWAAIWRAPIQLSRVNTFGSTFASKSKNVTICLCLYSTAK